MLVLGIPVVLLSGMFADIMGYQPPDLPLRGRRCGPSRRPRASRRRDRQRNGRSGVWPEDKGSAVADLQRQVIKSPWLATGSTAPGAGPGGRRHRIVAGTNVAVIIAGVVLAGSDPRSVLSVIELSRQSHRKMKQNLAWAAGYDLGHRCHWPPEFWARSDSCCR